MAVSGFAARTHFRPALTAVALWAALIGLGALSAQAEAAAQPAKATGDAAMAEDARCIAHVTTRIERGERARNAKDVKAMKQTLSELTAMFVLDGDKAGLSEAQATARRTELVAKRQQQWATADAKGQKAIFDSDNAFCFGKAFAGRYADAMMDIANLVDN